MGDVSAAEQRPAGGFRAEQVKPWRIATHSGLVTVRSYARTRAILTLLMLMRSRDDEIVSSSHGCPVQLCPALSCSRAVLCGECDAKRADSPEYDTDHGFMQDSAASVADAELCKYYHVSKQIHLGAPNVVCWSIKATIMRVHVKIKPFTTKAIENRF